MQELYLTALTQMFDPHTTFMNLKEKEKFDQQMNNEFVGIGAGAFRRRWLLHN